MVASIAIQPGRVYVGGNPYDVDTIRPIFNFNKTKVKIVHPYYDDFREIMPETLITDILNVNTGIDFTNLAELETAIKNGFYSKTV